MKDYNDDYGKRGRCGEDSEVNDNLFSNVKSSSSDDSIVSSNQVPGNRPPQQGGPGYRPPQNQGPGNRPPQQGGPGNRPPQQGGPGYRPPQNQGPGNRPPQQGGPGNRPPQQGGGNPPPPPNFTPAMPNNVQGPDAFLLGGQYGPNNLRSCLNRNTYMWLINGNNFWFFPVFVGRNHVEGFRWRRNAWTYERINLRSILFYICF